MEEIPDETMKHLVHLETLEIKDIPEMTEGNPHL